MGCGSEGASAFLGCILLGIQEVMVEKKQFLHPKRDGKVGGESSRGFF